MRRIGAYEILEELGRGGMGVVYRAYDPAINRLVAVKVMRLDILTDPLDKNVLQERLLREARSAGSLSHPGIVTIYHIGQEGDLAFIAMEHVDGASFEKMLAGDPPPGWEKIVPVLRKTAAALDYAHSKGVFHRDVKPANVLIDHNGDVKICDFGIAKMRGGSIVTQTGMRLGSPIYMSPEQVKGEELDGRSDQYSLAAMAYLALTGSPPFQGDQIESLFYKIVMEKPRAAQALNPRLPDEAGAVLERGLAKLAAERYNSCGGFVDALEAALRGPASELADVIGHARDLLDQRGPQAAEAYLEPLTLRYGADASFTAMFASVIDAKRLEVEGLAAQEARAEQARQRIEEVEAALAADRWQDAADVLVALEGDFPEESTLPPLWERIGRARDADAARQRTRQALHIAGEHFERGELREAAEVLERIEEGQKDEHEVFTMLGMVREAESAERQRRAHLAGLHQTLAQARRFLSQGAPSQAAMMLDAETARFGGDDEFKSRFAAVIEAERLERERQQREQERRRTEEARAEAERAVAERAAAAERSAAVVGATQMLQSNAARTEEVAPAPVTELLRGRPAAARPLRVVATVFAALASAVVLVYLLRPSPPKPKQPESAAVVSVPQVDQAGTPPTGPQSTPAAPKIAKPTDSRLVGAPVGGTPVADDPPPPPLPLPDPEEVDWRAVANTGSVAALENFLRKYPSGVHKADAARSVEQLEWNALQSQRDPAAWRAFLAKHPAGEFSKAASEKLEDIEWGLVNKKDAAALKGFLQEHPSGAHSTQAESAFENVAILDAIGKYAAAIEHRDIGQLLDIWPTISARDREQWQQDFRSTQSIAMRLKSEPTLSVVNGQTARADCPFITSKAYPGNAQVYLTDKISRITLRKTAKGWLIDSVR